MAQTIMELQISIAVFMDFNVLPTLDTGLVSLFNANHIHNSPFLTSLGKVTLQHHPALQHLLTSFSSRAHTQWEHNL